LIKATRQGVKRADLVDFAKAIKHSLSQIAEIIPASYSTLTVNPCVAAATKLLFHRVNLRSYFLLSIFEITLNCSLMNKHIIGPIYYVILLLLTGSFVTYKAYQFGQQVYFVNIKAEKGLIDLSKTSLDKKIIPLTGEYEFYWSEFITSVDFDSITPDKTGFIELPGLWNSYEINGKKLKGEGYATFRLIINVPDNDRYGIKIKEFDSAYRLWANGISVNSGTVSSGKDEIIPSWKRNEIYFPSIDKKVELILQVANFHHRKGGPEDVMLFGKAEKIIRLKYSSVATETFLLGLIFLTLLHHLGLFFFRTKDKSNLFFALINLIIGLRLLLTGEKLFLDIFPAINWFIAIRLEYLTVVLPSALFIYFFHSTFPQFTKKSVNQIVAVIIFVFSVAIIFLSPRVFTYIALVYQPFILFIMVYVIVFLVKALRLKEKYTWFLLLGVIFFALITINELLFYNKVIQTGYLLPFGLLVVIFSISYGLWEKFTNALNETERLKIELEKYNRQLEEIVKERTKVTENQKKLLEVQTMELRMAIRRQQDLFKFRETMTNMLVHDMINPLGAIINLDEHASKDFILLARQAGKQLLNLIQNIMEVQKFEEANIRVVFKKNNLFEVAGKACSQTEYSASLKNIDVFNKIPPTLIASFDAYLMERIFANLIFNAIKFTPENGRILIERKDEPDAIKICVIDNGTGIPGEFHKRIFEKYGQVENGKNSKSTGLGLTFCKMAVEAHGGEIGVISEINKGSTFWFTIPHRKIGK